MWEFQLQQEGVEDVSGDGAFAVVSPGLTVEQREIRGKWR